MYELSVKYSGYEAIETEEESFVPSSKQKTTSLTLNQLAAVSIFLVVIGAYLLFKTIPMPLWTRGKSTYEDNNGKVISFSFKRKGYDPVPYFNSYYNKLASYAFLASHISIIEPSAEMVFHMDDTSIYDVHYTVCDKTICQFGKWSAKDDTSDSFKFSCKPYDELYVTAKQYDGGKLIHTVTGTALCMYVRREIHALNEDDMARFIEVSAMLTSISDEEGTKTYGSNYLSSASIVKYHHFNAVQKDADHLHEGNGFLIQHIKLANMFEASLQSIDPSLSLPYWDFTIDSKEGKTMYDASIFAEKLYGTNYEAKTVTNGWTYSDDLILNGRIKDGAWKDQKVDMNPYVGDDYIFGFGYMRAPWNLNPSPYVSRYPLIETTARIEEFYMPTCTDHYHALMYDDRMDFYQESSFDPHGNLHILEGGVYGCDLLNPLVDAGYITDYNTVCYYWVFALKELYRAGIISPNKDCKVAPNIQDTFCGYSCAHDGADVFAKVESVVGIGLNKDKEGIEDAFKDFVCGGDGGRIFPGDHLESASPADPSFWVIHPTLERLLHAKLLAGGFQTSNEWPTDSKRDYVCDKSSFCYGHYQDDQMYDGLVGSTSKYFGPTNRETESGTDSASAEYAMPYIYDNFDWNHCSEEFDALLNDLSDDMKDFHSGGNMRRVTNRRVACPVAQDKMRAKKAKLLEEYTKA